jgi:hypothetical protein
MLGAPLDLLAFGVLTVAGAVQDTCDTHFWEMRRVRLSRVGGLLTLCGELAVRFYDVAPRNPGLTRAALNLVQGCSSLWIALQLSVSGIHLEEDLC